MSIPKDGGPDFGIDRPPDFGTVRVDRFSPSSSPAQPPPDFGTVAPANLKLFYDPLQKGGRF
jgi:hypothetical protein